MGKRSGFREMRPRDLWGTVDPDAVKSLLPFIVGKTYAEPCVGYGDLIKLLDNRCEWASDVFSEVGQGVDATELTKDDLKDCDLIITNPPFSWSLLEPLLKHLPTLKPTWLLLPADFMHNKRSGPYMKNCQSIVSIGRLYWVLDEGVKPIKGKENYCWYFWPKLSNGEYGTKFYGR